MSAQKPWQPRMRGNPIFNPFEPPTDRTRDLGANERVEIPEDEATSEGEVKQKDQEPASK